MEWSGHSVVVGLGSTAAARHMINVPYTAMMAVVSGRVAFSARRTVFSWLGFRQLVLYICAAPWKDLWLFLRRGINAPWLLFRSWTVCSI